MAATPATRTCSRPPSALAATAAVVSATAARTSPAWRASCPGCARSCPAAATELRLPTRGEPRAVAGRHARQRVARCRARARQHRGRAAGTYAVHPGSIALNSNETLQCELSTLPFEKKALACSCRRFPTLALTLLTFQPHTKIAHARPRFPPSLNSIVRRFETCQFPGGKCICAEVSSRSSAAFVVLCTSLAGGCSAAAALQQPPALVHERQQSSGLQSENAATTGTAAATLVAACQDTINNAKAYTTRGGSDRQLHWPALPRSLARSPIAPPRTCNT